MIRFLSVLALAFTVGGCGGELPQPFGAHKPCDRCTQLLQWSPFDANGVLKHAFRVKTVKGGCGDPSASEMIGGVGYRCGFANYIIQTCWAERAGLTDSVICPTAPWDRTVLRLRIGPRFIFDQGVTYSSAPGYPWALELANGNRCLMIPTGTGPMPTPAGRRIDRYICNHGINLAEPLRKGRPWTAAAARWSARTGWKIVGYLPIRRVYYAGLPPALARQNSLAHSAANAAWTVARARVTRALGKPETEGYVYRVRLAFPEMRWARGDALFFIGDTGERYASVVLHRTARGWTPVASKGVCSKLPRRALVQLVTHSECSR